MTRKLSFFCVAMVILVSCFCFSTEAKSEKITGTAYLPVDGIGWRFFEGDVKNNPTEVIFEGQNGNLRIKMISEEGAMDDEIVIIQFDVHVWGRESDKKVNYRTSMDMLVRLWNGKIFIFALPPMPPQL